MEVLGWMCMIFLARFGKCYENLSRRRTTTLSQSSTYKDRTASWANDGVNSTTEEYCAHTDPTSTDTRAWFQVDLGKPYSIKSVKIIYRKEGVDPNQWKQFRFSQYYLDVSDSPATSTTTSQRTRCYTDNSTAPALPPNIIEIPCKQTARYIIVETNYIFQTDPGPVLEICEIEVYGQYCNSGCIQGQCNDDGFCTQGCVHGYWGKNCSEQCSSTCSMNSCHRNGNCYACKSSYTGIKCETRLCPNCYQQVCAYDNGVCSSGCVAGYYGNHCSKRCSHRCNPRICDSSTGNCTYNCTNGYYGPKCETPCSTTCSTLWCRKFDGECVNGCQEGFYGFRCRQQCSPRCKNNICNFSSGHRDRGCNDGFYGNFCYLNCHINCARGRCSQWNGFCSDECLLNWAGSTCEQCRPDFYGSDCSKKCSSNYLGGHCHLENGSCLGGCKMGYKGHQCNLECNPNYYGSDCSEKCSSNCLDGHCHAENGSCLGGCNRGYQGQECTIECEDYKYGVNCLFDCGHCRDGKPCVKTNGSCLSGCEAGWGEIFCLKVSSSIKAFQADDGISKTSSIIMSIISTLFAVTLIFIGVKVILNKRRRRGTQRKKEQTDSKHAAALCSSYCAEKQCDTHENCILGCTQGYWGK